MTNNNPANTSPATPPTSRPEAIFLTGRFRSGTTLLWNLFHRLPQCCAYYEPANDLLPVYVRHNMPPSPSHVGVESYWDEYFPIQEKLFELHRPEFGVNRLFLDENDEYPEFEKYIQFLIDSARPKIPVLKFCRVDFRLPWLRKRFPQARIVHLFRNPRELWYSMIRDLPAGQEKNLEVNTNYDLIAWSCALWKEMPFLTNGFITNPYQRHYLLWYLSKKMGERQADITIDYNADMLSNPRECIHGMLKALAIDGNIDILSSLVTPISTGTRKGGITPEHMEVFEDKCKELLTQLGLLEEFGVKSLEQIITEHPQAWEKFSGEETHEKAMNRALSLFTQSRRAGAATYHSLRARVRMTDKLYNTDKGGASSVPQCAANAKFVGQPDANREHAREEFQAGRIILESLPSIVTFALTTCCNNRRPCLVCDRNLHPEVMGMDTSQAVIDAMAPVIATARYLLLHTGGEAMISKYYDDVIDLVQSPTEVTFATNAMLMNNNRADRMLRRDIMGKLVVSLDAATPEIYRIQRPGSIFETVINNIKYYTARAKSLERKKARVELNMTICKSNLRDVPRLVDLAVEVGASGVSFQRMNSGLSFTCKTVDEEDWNYEDQSTFDDPLEVDRVILQTYRLAQKAGLEMMYTGSLQEETIADPANTKAVRAFTGVIPFEDDLNSMAKKEASQSAAAITGPRRCRKRWEEINVMPNGQVRICCYHRMSSMNLGTVMDTDLMAIWNSDTLVRERVMALSNQWPETCTTAPAVCVHRGRR